MDLEIIILNKVTQMQKEEPHGLPMQILAFNIHNVHMQTAVSKNVA